MTRMLAILALAALAVGCGTSPRAVERKGRIISLTDSILTTGGTDTVRFGRLGSGEIAVLRLWLANDASRPGLSPGPSPPTGAAADARRSNLTHNRLHRATHGR